MSYDNDGIWVNGCPFCEIFSKGKLPSKRVYYTTKHFIILDYPNNKYPLVVVRNHVTEINKTEWGWILHVCREKFGWGMRLHIMEGRNLPLDHWYAQIVTSKKEY